MNWKYYQFTGNLILWKLTTYLCCQCKIYNFVAISFHEFGPFVKIAKLKWPRNQLAYSILYHQSGSFNWFNEHYETCKISTTASGIWHTLPYNNSNSFTQWTNKKYDCKTREKNKKIIHAWNITITGLWISCATRKWHKTLVDYLSPF